MNTHYTIHRYQSLTKKNKQYGTYRNAHLYLKHFPQRNKFNLENFKMNYSNQMSTNQFNKTTVVLQFSYFEK